jgi:hypothetical protein
MIPSVLFGLFTIVSAEYPSPPVWEFVECYKQKSCQLQDYTGVWDVVNIGTTLRDKCGSLKYWVNIYQDTQLQLFETCKANNIKKFMYGVPIPALGLMSFNSGVGVPRGSLPGMIYYWKKNGIVVAASVRHPLLSAAPEEFVRPLWLKEELLTEQEQKSIMWQHSMWGL